MSRIIVKNLPQKITSDKLQSHFSKIGLITDIKLVYKKCGQFRGFAFIGFESQECAEAACNEFRNTYFKQNKINVEMCQGIDYKRKKEEEDLEGKNKLNLSRENKTNQYNALIKELTREKLKEHINDPDFIQYLKVNDKYRSNLISSLKKKYNLDNENKESEEVVDSASEMSENENNDKQESKNKSSIKSVSDWEYLASIMKSKEEKNNILFISKTKKNWKDYPTIVIRTKEQNTNKIKKGKTLTKKVVKEFLKPLKARSLRIPRKTAYVAYVGFDSEKEVKQILLKDKSFLDGVRVRIHKYIKEGYEESSNSAPWRKNEKKVREIESTVADTGKLFVRNLWYSATEDELKKLFGRFGMVADITLPISRLSRKIKGFAHVTYVMPEDAVKAINELDGTIFQGRILHILPSLTVEEESSDSLSFKEKKKKELKKSASSWHNWNSLFLGSSAVIDLVSTNYKTSKRQLLDSDSANTAVNLALGETHIVVETKKFLESSGICLDAFNPDKLERSSTVILVKNLPSFTNAEEIKNIFEKFGLVGRVVMPPSGVTAIVEFLDSSEAKKSFSELAYTRFKDAPLYLEWAPIGIFKKEVASNFVQSLKSHKNVENKISDQNNKNGDKSIEDSKNVKSNETNDNNVENNKNSDKNVDNNNKSEIYCEPDTTVFIKGLNFKTDEDAILRHFSEFGPIASALVSRRRGLSQGFGFIQFQKSKDAKKASKLMRNTLLDGSMLTLKLSEKKLNENSKALVRQMTRDPGEANTSKILIKNIPFQATTREVQQLFKSFGELKSIRLPIKAGGNEHRGFGFVEFSAIEEAKKAFEALSSSTHLYGRRLVLEWAKEDETVEELRKKTADRFLASESSAKKKRKIETSAENEKFYR